MKRFFWLPLVLLSACGKPIALPEIPPVNVNNITGTISHAKGGTIQLIASDNKYFTAEKSTIGADGKFNINLPEPTRLSNVPSSFDSFKEFCTITSPITSSHPNVKALGIVSAKVNEETTPYYAATSNVGGGNFNQNRNVQVTAWVYVDAPTKITGAMDCTKLTQGLISSVPVNVDAELLKGWNAVTLSINAGIGLGLQGSGEIRHSNGYTGEWTTLNALANRLKP